MSNYRSGGHKGMCAYMWENAFLDTFHDWKKFAHKRMHVNLCLTFSVSSFVKSWKFRFTIKWSMDANHTLWTSSFVLLNVFMNLVTMCLPLREQWKFLGESWTDAVIARQMFGTSMEGKSVETISGKDAVCASQDVCSLKTWLFDWITGRGVQKNFAFLDFGEFWRYFVEFSTIFWSRNCSSQPVKSLFRALGAMDNDTARALR